MSTSLYKAARTKVLTTNTKPDSTSSPTEDDLNAIGSPQHESEDGDNFKTTRIELVDITEKAKGYGDQPSVYLTCKLHQAKENRGKYDDFALLLRRKVDKEGDALSTALEVQSPIIRYALQVVLSSNAYLNLAASPIIIKKPYDALFHYRKELREYASAAVRTNEEKEHLNVLIEFMKLNLDPIERLYEQMVPKGMVTFDLLWTLFRSEDDILLQTENYQECYRTIYSETKFINQEKFLEIEAWRWGYNGSKFGPSIVKLLIPAFSASRRITQLPIFPLNSIVIPDQEKQSQLRSRLIERGRNWRGLVGICHREYNGPIWVNGPGYDKAKSVKELVVTYENTRIILDHERHQRDNYWLATSLIGANGFIQPKTNDPFSIFGSRMWDDPFSLRTEKDKSSNLNKAMLSQMQCHENNEFYEMTDEQALLCPAQARGFSLTSKKFGLFLVDEIKDTTWTDHSYDMLEIDPEMKSTIEALVWNHGSPSLRFDDFVANKGKGLIFLLHGPPGAGKTLTAESIAEATHKPLYHIGTGELGTEIASTEAALLMIFERAKAWDAVLLLDEADLFLSKRTRDDIRRNAFVTVFLRLLEYYEGILFLTTNRVEEFDPAFKSRIHLSIQYDALDDEKRVKIWRNLLTQIDECKSWKEDTFQRLGKDFQLNGREIKNLIKPALAIAAHNKIPLTEEVLRLVYRINYMSSALMKEE